ncbi:MAG: Mrp/NBP35 family ATP-binding protein [Verrucomicrobiota bacterium]
MPSDTQVREALSQVNYPGFSRDIVSFGLVKDVALDGDNVTVDISLATRDPKSPQLILEGAQAALDAIPGIGDAKINFDIKEPPASASQPGPSQDDPAAGQSSIPGVKKIIAVASGKGGVGKSTVASNLAVALAQSEGNPSVGLCDCDLYGPSIALMFGADDQPLANDQNQIIPIIRHGLKIMSMGLLLDDTSAAIVRGPMATRYTQQFLRQVAWDELDYLILDLPPGTGDIQLTIVQTVALDGAVIVTTPQEVALIDARKAVSMFGKVNVPILGIVENMSYFEADDGTRYDIFGKGGGAKEAERCGVPLLGQIPIDIATRERADQGTPVATLPQNESPASKVFHEVAAEVVNSIPKIS